MTAFDHARHLVEVIGPRGSTTPQERQAAEYAHQQLAQVGLDPILETFPSARSAWLPPALFWSLLLAAGFLFVGASRSGTVAALVLAVLALSSMILELLFRPNPLRWILPRAEGTNVWAKIPANRETRTRVALVAHLDTHRTPLVFSTDRWVRAFERLVPIGMAIAVMLIGIFIVGVIHPIPWLRYAAIGPMTVVFGMMLLMLQADFTEYAPGANDNASGVGVVLSMAERLAGRSLAHTDVWIVLTGCEEVGCYGAQHFLRNHRSELGEAAWIAVDTVGSTHGHPVYLSQETFLSTTRSAPDLLSLVRAVSAEHPELGAREVRMKGAYTDGAIGGKAGLRVITLESHRPSGMLSDWHRPTDIAANVSIDCMAATEMLLAAALDRLDADAAPN